ncbi:MAG: diadenosine tetraphosphate hydrolase [Caulobacterales bacterium 68-7]|nr:HIT domain-containing protein [Caulobacterales bacterium]OJU12499.1 MAG: diadenosine tetraphosphate hydrolase [Caulobacterales bacterium 68-7]
MTSQIPDPEAGFALAPPFLATSSLIGRLSLCEARLQSDARWPWICLIPRRAGLVEVGELSVTDRAQLIEEAVACGAAVRAIGEATGFIVEKLNIGALGNVTPQLHVHVVGRRPGDPAWAGPVWGAGRAEPYSAAGEAAALAAARASLGL